ncbi:hypothetical protein GGU10DRAFT_437990 [Lentinula aff. detonsa]|uniref:Uncharacterized protein n=1 Tax=Lentinula aff. detonsa TaxID=2804958 RepID=A0AA38L2F6_9AGAR|nr:hypothetical protein GGU10DRAFT_437990 [Lentinula aff. detonsa]
MVYLHSMFTAVFAVGVAPSVFAAPVTTLTTTGFIPSSESTSQAMHIAIRDSVHFPQHGTTYSGSYPDAAGQSPASNIEAAYMHNHIPVNPQYGLHQPDPASTLTAHYVPKAAQNPVRGVRRKGNHYGESRKSIKSLVESEVCDDTMSTTRQLR